MLKIRDLIPPIILHIAKMLLRPTYRELHQISTLAKKRMRHECGKIKTKNGVFKYVDFASFEYMYRTIFYDEIYNIGTEKKNMYIIDAGANIGVSVKYFHDKYPASKIIAFEADEFVFNILKSNCGNFSNVELFNIALWDKEGFVDFYSEKADSGRIHCNDLNWAKTTVKSELLSKYINEEVSLLKIDIEGAERNVLFEIKDKLIMVNALYIEYHSFENSPQCLDEILLILRQAGFRYYISDVNNQKRNYLTQKYLLNSMDLQLHVFATKEYK